MLMDVGHALIRSLVTEWEGDKDLSEEQRSRRSKALQAQLAQGISHSLQPYQGQLVLLYHEFLTMEPTGEHSFAHGSTMGSKTVYWVHAARLHQSSELIEERSPGNTLGNEEFQVHIAPSTKFLVPVAWQRFLYPYYPGGSHRPSFGFKLRGRFLTWTTRREPDTISQPTRDPLDISCLGEHFFRVHQGPYDWATKIYLVVGTVAVRIWLEEHHSGETCQSLEAFQGL